MNTSVWYNVSASISGGWLVAGNAGTEPLTQFRGTSDNIPFRFRLNNKWAGELNTVTKNYSIGDSAGQAVTSGMFNVAVGSRALGKNTSGSWNTAIGTDALYYNTGN